MGIVSIIFGILSLLGDAAIGILFSNYKVDIYSSPPIYEWILYCIVIQGFSIAGIVLGSLGSKRNLPGKKVAKAGFFLSLFDFILLLVIILLFVGYGFYILAMLDN